MTGLPKLRFELIQQYDNPCYFCDGYLYKLKKGNYWKCSICKRIYKENIVSRTGHKYFEDKNEQR